MNEAYKAYELDNVDIYIAHVKSKITHYSLEIDLTSSIISKACLVTNKAKKTKILQNSKDFISHSYDIIMNIILHNELPIINNNNNNTNTINEPLSEDIGKFITVVNLIEDSRIESQNNLSMANNSQGEESDTIKNIIIDSNDRAAKNKANSELPPKLAIESFDDKGGSIEFPRNQSLYSTFEALKSAELKSNNNNQKEKLEQNKSILIKGSTSRRALLSPEDEFLNFAPISPRIQESNLHQSDEFTPRNFGLRKHPTDEIDDEPPNLENFMHNTNQLAYAIDSHRFADKQNLINQSSHGGLGLQLKNIDDSLEFTPRPSNYLKRNLRVSNKRKTTTNKIKVEKSNFLSPRSYNEEFLNLSNITDNQIGAGVGGGNVNGGGGSIVCLGASNETAKTPKQTKSLQLNLNMTFQKVKSFLYDEEEVKKEHTNEQDYARYNRFGKMEKSQKKQVHFFNEIEEFFIKKGSKKSLGPEGSVSSTRSGTISATKKLFRNFLTDQSTPSAIQRLNTFGILSLTALIILISVLYGTFSNMIIDYGQFIETADFTCPFTFGISQFHKDVEKSQMIIDNLWYFSEENFLEMQNRTKYFELNAFNNFKNTFQNKVLNFNLEGLAKKFKYSKFDTKYIQYSNGNLSITTIEFIYAISINLNFLDKILNGNLTAIANDVGIKEYFWLNYANFFYSFTSATSELFQYLYGTSQVINVQEFSQTTLIICLSISAIFLVCVYPTFRRVENMRNRGLGLLNTFKILEIETKMKTIEFAKLALNQVNDNEINIVTNLNEKGAKNKENISNLQKRKLERLKTSIKPRESARRQTFREWRKQKIPVFYLGGGLLLIFSLLTLYFVLMSEIIKSNNRHFLPLIQEYDMMTDIWSFIPAAYAITYRLLNLYNNTDTESISTIFHGYDNIIERIEGRVNDCLSWKQVLPNYLANPEISNEYKATIIAFYTQNICDFIVMNDFDKNRCKRLVLENAKLGICGIYDLMQENLWRFYAFVIGDQPYNITVARQIIDTQIFEEMDILLDYVNIIIERFNSLLNQELNHNLYHQQINGTIFLGVGIGGIGILLLLLWLPFINKMKNDFLLVKRVFSTIHIDMLIMNNYIKKFLRDNSQNR